MTENRAYSRAVTLEQATAPDDLRDHLAAFYEVRGDASMYEATEKADFGQFRFLLSGEGEYVFADGEVQPAPRIQIIGPTTGPTHFRVRGPFQMVGAALLPPIWRTFDDYEACLLVNRVIDATELFGDLVKGAGNVLRAAPSFEARTVFGAGLARTLLTRSTSPPFHFTRIVGAWLESSPAPQIDTLVTLTGLSRRHLERRCNACYGSPPKVLARKYRALRAAIALARGEATMTTVMHDGFQDQSHVIREIKAFTGVTPIAAASDLPTLAALVLSGRRATDPATLATQT